MTRLFAVLFALLLLLPSLALAAIREGAEIVPLQIRDDFWVLYGGMGLGSTVGVSVGDDGILLVDAMHAVSNDRLLKAIRAISDRPIRYVINTHEDADHSGGNAFFAGMGATIISHDNVRYSDAVRQLTFSDRLTLRFNGDEVEAHHVVSHSYSDVLVYFPAANVLFLGDAHATDWLPTFNTGSMAGQFEAVDLALSLADDDTVVVPGHGPVDGRAGLLAYREHCGEWLIRVRELRAQGVGIEEMAKDPRLGEIVAWFGRQRSEPIPEDRVVRQIARTVSSELVSAYPLSTQRLNTFVGRYEVEGEPDVEIVAQGDHLVLRQPGAFIVDLIPLSETRFHPRGFLSGDVRFETAESGRVLGFTLSSEHVEMTARKL